MQSRSWDSIIDIVGVVDERTFSKGWSSTFKWRKSSLHILTTIRLNCDKSVELLQHVVQLFASTLIIKSISFLRRLFVSRNSSWWICSFLYLEKNRSDLLTILGITELVMKLSSWNFKSGTENGCKDIKRTNQLKK